jgi:site-specific DNA recombinase
VSAVLYTRVSTDEQSRRNAANLPTQEKKCRDHCAREGLRVVRVFVDKESARTTNREQLQELLWFCVNHAGKVTHVVVADLSRLARNVADQAIIIGRLSNLGITLHSVDEPHLDQSAAGKLSANLLGSVNQFYSDVLSERVKYRMQEATKAGRFLHRAPLGYRNAQVNGTKNLAIDGEPAALIRKAFEMLATGNHTAEAVRKTVTAMGLHPCRSHGFQTGLEPVARQSHLQRHHQVRRNHRAGKL